MELAREIQGVIDHLQELKITSNYETMNVLMWSMQTLAKVRDKLKEAKPDGNDLRDKLKEAKPDGNDHAE